MRTLPIGVFFSTLFTTSALATAADLQGAQTAVRKEAAVLRDPTANADPGASVILRKRADTYAAAMADLPPGEAVSEWGDMMKEAFRLAGDTSQQFEWPGTNPLVYVLERIPSPDLWNKIAKDIQKQTVESEMDPLALELAGMFGALITNRHDDAWAIATEIEPIYEERFQRSPRLLESLAESSPNDERPLQLFELALEQASKDRWSIHYLTVPDLVTLAGPDRAEELLNSALKLSGVTLNFSGGDETVKLARKLALENLDQLEMPPWELALDVKALSLFEALRKKFPRQARNGTYAQRNAAGYYIVGLILADRADEAIELLPTLVAEADDADGRNLPGSEFTLPSGAIRALRRTGHATELYTFLRKLLARHPELPFWQTYIELSIELGHRDNMYAFTTEIMAKPGLSPAKKVELQSVHARGILASGQTDEAIPRLLEIAREAQDTPSKEYLGVQLDVATDLITIGALLKKPALTDEAQQIAGDLLLRARLEGVGDASSAIGDTDRVALALAKADREVAAEGLLIENLERSTREAAKQSTSRPNLQTFDRTRDRIVNLAAFYHEAGRHDDVLILLDKAQGWGAGDVSTILREESPFSPDPMGIIVARALGHAGRTDDARRMVNAFLDLDGSKDSAYELLLELGGPDVGERLDELYARDRFEERPLIWKAQLFINENDLAKAEETVRVAIAIDPSDGEQGKGDRMRAYAVLGDILMLKADEKQAHQIASEVRAIRMSEDADDFNAAGLHSQAIAMYQEALSQFADAYCIQSRLAIQLAEQGRLKEAEKHYLRAYELMPDSFGRIESHCFDCEGAFRGEPAQSIADKIFTSLIENSPDKPQLHYLLGYLRAGQERHEEALESYLRAVELDPDYVNAWAKIQALSSTLPLPAAVRDDTTVNLFRLDPLGRHTHPDLDEMTDLARQWKTVADYRIAIPPTPTTLYPLTASTQPGMAVVVEGIPSSQSPTPGEALVQHRALRTWLRMLQHVAWGNH